MAGRRRLPSQASGSPRAASGWELEAPAAARQRALLSWPRRACLSLASSGFIRCGHSEKSLTRFNRQDPDAGRLTEKITHLMSATAARGQTLDI